MFNQSFHLCSGMFLFAIFLISVLMVCLFPIMVCLFPIEDVDPVSVPANYSNPVPVPARISFLVVHCYLTILIGTACRELNDIELY